LKGTSSTAYVSDVYGSNAVQPLIRFLNANAQQPPLAAEAVAVLRLLLQTQQRTFHVRVGQKDHTHKFAKRGSEQCFVIEEEPGRYGKVMITDDDDDDDDVFRPLRKLKLIRGGTYIFRVNTPSNRVFYLSKKPEGVTEKKIFRVFGRRTQEREDDYVTKYHDVELGVTGAGNYGEPGTIIFSPDRTAAYHKRARHANIYWACRDPKQQFMGGKIKLLDAKHGIAAHIKGASDALIRVLQVTAGANDPASVELQLEV